MKILIVGGTQMVGRDFVEYYLENKKDCDIYLANRNVTNPNLFDCKQILIDRNSKEKCKSLSEHGEFDIVVDFSCYNLSQFTHVLSSLKYKKYYMISTMSVPNLDATLNDRDHHEYATNKLDVENYIKINLKDKVCIVRPCVIYGDNDYTQRFHKNDAGFFFHNHNNQLVENDSNYIFLRDFTIRLSQIINDEVLGAVNIVGDNVERDGFYKIHPQESKYINKKMFEYPFKHIVIDNLFNEKKYKEICSVFHSVKKSKEEYYFENDEADYVFMHSFSSEEIKRGLDFFASKYLQNFINQEFNIETNNYLAISAHCHDSFSKRGGIHTDSNIVSFKNDETKDFILDGDCLDVSYACDTKNYNKKVMRSGALLYYLDNSDSIDSFGGGTGIFDGYGGNLIKTIEPKNNRLFIFEITSNSYHAFLGANFPRSCIVCWFHSSPSYMLKRHGSLEHIERWPKSENEEYWEVTEDPEYDKYFNRKLVQKYETLLEQIRMPTPTIQSQNED